MSRDDGDKLVSPLAERRGHAEPRPPWEYRVLAVVPHLDPATAEPLGPCLELLRLQTERPYLCVIDTGSPWRVREALEQHRAPDCEVHYLRAHGWSDKSEPVTAALDLGFALSRGCEYVYLTHSDVFARRRDLLARMAAHCGPDCPVVAYRMSPRPWAGNFWQECPGHCCALFHAPTYHRLGLSWSIPRTKAEGKWETRVSGWPDTETGMGHRLKAAGIVPRWIGNEQAWAHQVDDCIDHAHSFTGARIYGAPEHALQANRWMDEALADAAKRIEAWRKEADLGSD